VAVDHERAYVLGVTGSTGTVVAYALASGDEVWRAPLDGDIVGDASSTFVDAIDDVVLVQWTSFDEDGSNRIHTVALAADRGTVRWDHAERGGGGPWRGWDELRRPVVDDGVLVVGATSSDSADDPVRGIDLGDGSARWSDGTNLLGVCDGVAFTLTRDGEGSGDRVAAVDVADGSVRYEVTPDEDVLPGGGCAGSTLVLELGGTPGRVVALDDGGKERWSIEGSGTIWVADGVVYRFGESEGVDRLDAATGESRWTLPWENTGSYGVASVSDALAIVDGTWVDPGSGRVIEDQDHAPTLRAVAGDVVVSDGRHGLVGDVVGAKGKLERRWTIDLDGRALGVGADDRTVVAVLDGKVAAYSW
jgi:hypothetical protein